MGVIPMQEDSGVQELYTRDHGVVKVDKLSWQDGGYHIVKCPNGAYCHNNNLPIRDEKEIHAAFGIDQEGNCPNEEAKQKCLNWFRNRHNQAGKAPRPVGMHPDGYPVFDDGTVPDFDDLYAYFRPGKGLTGMIVALQDYKDRSGATGPPKELRKATAPETEEVPESMKSQQAAPTPLPAEREKAEMEKAEMEKARAKQAKTRAQNLKNKNKIKAAQAAQKAAKTAQLAALPQG